MLQNHLSLCPWPSFSLLHTKDLLFRSPAKRSSSLKREQGAWGWKDETRCSRSLQLQSTQHSWLGAGEVQDVHMPYSERLYPQGYQR